MPGRRGRPPRELALIAILTGAVVVAAGCALSSPAGPSPAVEPTPTPTSAQPAIDGVPIMSVAELLAGRAAGSASGGPYALRGYWSVRTFPHACGNPGPPGQPGELEIACSDGEWGITDASEAILEVEQHDFRGATQTVARSAHLTPWFASTEVRTSLFAMPDQHWTPVPIVVIGHFDDPKADLCRQEARQLCLDRFVIDQVVDFDPAAVPSPTPSPSPTPFPTNDPPPAPLTEAQCFAGVEKSFVGWSRLGDLGIRLKDGWDPNEYVYTLVTANVVPIGDPTVQGEDTWHSDDRYAGRKVRWMGRQACLSQESTSVYSATVIGSTYLEIDDGRKVFAPYPFF